jgi:quercetin dioxygenase-like cupin family protein
MMLGSPEASMRRVLLVLCLLSTCFAQTKHKAGIVPNGEGPKKYNVGFGTAVMKVTAAETGGKWSMVDFTANPGMQTPVHRHRKTDETFYVIEGEFTFYIDGKLATLHPGDMANVPRMTPHAFANLTNKPARLLGTLTPSGFEKFFALTAELVKKSPPGTPGFQAGQMAIMKQVDMEPLGPPPFGKPGRASH